MSELCGDGTAAAVRLSIAAQLDDDIADQLALGSLSDRRRRR